MIGRAFSGRKPIVLGILALAVFVIGGFVAWRALRLSELGHIGAGYAAQQTCACVFVSHRALASCMTDLDPLAQRVVSVRVGTDDVTARTLGLNRAVARYEQGFGCSLRD
ncbi:MAG TPA: hypothetical protein VK540_09345 [Polyangiaceae bacterium]|jgi:hypothetical protein|nr:hypothetical protein [Polyangiaceae bacterium]